MVKCGLSMLHFTYFPSQLHGKKPCVHFYGLYLSVFIMHAIFNLNDNLFNIYMCSTDVTLKVCLQLFHLFLVISSH